MGTSVSGTETAVESLLQRGGQRAWQVVLGHGAFGVIYIVNAEFIG